MPRLHQYPSTPLQCYYSIAITMTLQKPTELSRPCRIVRSLQSCHDPANINAHSGICSCHDPAFVKVSDYMEQVIHKERKRGAGLDWRGQDYNTVISRLKNRG